MSSLNLNKVILAGHITETPELKQTQNGIPVCQVRIMVNRRKAQEGQQAADGFNVVCWRQTAEFVCRYFKKGSAICFFGFLSERNYTAQNGEKRYITEVVAEEAMFVDSANGSENRENNAGATKEQKSNDCTQKSKSAENAQKASQNGSATASAFTDDENLTF